MNNVIHENDIQYIIAENFFNENVAPIIFFGGDVCGNNFRSGFGVSI